MLTESLVIGLTIRISGWLISVKKQIFEASLDTFWVSEFEAARGPKID